MTINIETVNATEINAWMYAKTVVAIYDRHKGALPPDNFLEEMIDEARKSIRECSPFRHIRIHSFWWCGDKSGKAWADVFVKEIASKIKGQLTFVLEWEGGSRFQAFLNDGQLQVIPITESSVYLNEEGIKKHAEKHAKEEEDVKARLRRADRADALLRQIHEERWLVGTDVGDALKEYLLSGENKG